MRIERKLREAKIAEALYKACIGKITEEKAVETPFGIKDKLVVPFEVENGTQPLEIKKRYNYSIHENSSFAGLIRDVTGNLPKERFDLDTLEGQRCQVVVALLFTERLKQETCGRTFRLSWQLLRSRQHGMWEW